ncbi:MAG: glycosyltransferase, partial [Candidatus Aenigmatarchaeota archaeon]
MISVVIPALNEEKFIGQCLRSIKKQDYSGEYEIIVMDNGSEDRTVQIAEKYADKIFSFPSLNLPELRNKGIRRS